MSMIAEKDLIQLRTLLSAGADIKVHDGLDLIDECLRLREVLRDIIKHQKIVGGSMTEASVIYKIAAGGLGDG